MTFNITVPNASQSPGIFPAQNNTNFNRLQALISGDHQFNNTAAANDGRHKQVTYINKPSGELPVTTLPAGTNLVSFTKNALDNIPDLWLFDGTNTQYQYSWREKSGTVTLNDSSLTIVTSLPTNSYGTIYMLFPNGSGVPNISMGFFITNATLAKFYTEVINQFSGAFSASPKVVFGPGGLSLDLDAQTISSVLNGSWFYKIQYRKYA